MRLHMSFFYSKFAGKFVHIYESSIISWRIWFADKRREYLQTQADDRNRWDAYPMAYHEGICCVWTYGVYHLCRIQAGVYQAMVCELFLADK